MYKIEQFSSKFSLYDSVALVNADHWNSVVDSGNIYLTIPYLQALEQALNSEIDFRYTIFYNDQLKPVAVSYVQVIRFADKGAAHASTLSNLSDRFKNKLLQQIDARILICGNVFATGENGFAYTNDLKPKDAFKILARSMKALSEEEDAHGQISFGLVKEFWMESTPKSDYLFDSSFKGFMIDVNMILYLRSEWKSMEDYLAAMTTKYRTKTKGVFKKSDALNVVDLSVEQIIEHRDRIDELYHQVLESADFKIGEMNSQAFINFKQNLQERFTLKAYYLEDKMIGFITLFHCNNLIDANCMGLDYAFNRDYAVYQRMLYDAVDLSIQNGIGELRLGRTAELLKSSIGAEPVNMKLYLRHRNGISNKMIGPLISSISPSEYELRPPFKKALS